jgi:DNA-binding ferritin-like protein
MNQTTKERYRELVQSGIDIQREFIDQYTQIMTDMTLSTQEKEQRVQELFEHYGNLLEGIDIQMDNVLRNMGENQLAWTNEMGINLMDTADTAAENISNLTGNTRTQLNLLFNDARTDAETWKTAILEIINEVSKSWSNYCSQLTTVQDTSKTTLDDMIKQIIEYGK